ncbi:MAG TPA: hydroxylamine reductase [Candidatus Aminicenantes bacterium]|nr:hydroxylamine reductase [Candidatus Aminicenantes bacterium]
MEMFCYQCQETVGNKGCTRVGVCGKQPDTAGLQDTLIYTCRGIALLGEKAFDLEAGRFITRALFATITNANFDNQRFVTLIQEGLNIRDSLKSALSKKDIPGHDAVNWTGDNLDDLIAKGAEVGVLATKDEDIRSLRELTILGLKGLSAYTDHAAILGHEDEGIYRFAFKALADTTRDLDAATLTNLVIKTGETAVAAMALLDKANTATYGHPEITEVHIGVRNNPGILISGHDLRDMEDLLQQTEATGIDVYTHSEMLPANYYPAFKKYSHFAGNYGNAWWRQKDEFASFNGPILMTTNCITPVQDAYRERIFTTGMAGYPGIPHIPDRKDGKPKDFSALIQLAKSCPPPKEIETGTIIGGFAHHQVIALAEKVVEAVKSGAIKRFVVMAGCDGRHKSREYFTRVAEKLPADAVILTAGCAKYRYNKLQLGDIGGIPRVLDAGQCNDSYSLAVIALKLKEVFELEDVNELPLSFDIAWYEQKAITVLLALLALGFKKIRLGPTLPAFLSPNVTKVLVERFNIRPTAEVDADVAAIMAGE